MLITNRSNNSLLQESVATVGHSYVRSQIRRITTNDARVLERWFDTV